SRAKMDMQGRTWKQYGLRTMRGALPRRTSLLLRSSMAHAAHVILLLLFFIPSVCAQWNFVRWDSAFRADPRNPALVNRAVEAIEDQYLYNKPDSALLIADRILAGGISSKDPLIQLEGWYQKGAALHQKGAFDHAE